MREGEPGWFASLLGAAVLIAGGFALGLVAGVVSEEPELVVGHLVGRSEEVAWLPEGEAEFTPADEEIAGLDLRAAGSVLPDGEPFVEKVEIVRPSLPSVAAAPPPVPSTPRPVTEPPQPRRRVSAPVREISSIPEAVPAASAAPRAGFAVQVGAFADGSSADNVREELRGKGFETYVIPASSSGDGKWRVRVGPVATRAAAERLAGRLKSEERLPTWVLSEGGG